MGLLHRFAVVLCLVIIQNISAFAGAWSDQDVSAYVGNWKGNGFPSKFSHASGVEISFWLTAEKQLEGAIMFSKGQGYCVGHVQLDASQERLEFSAKEGTLCPDLANSTFSLFRPMKRGVFGLRFHTSPPGNDLYNVTHFHKANESNTKLHAYVDFFQNSGQDTAHIQNSQEQNLEQALSGIDAAMRQPYSLEFNDSKMIGVWQGEFVDKQTVHPARMVSWSGVPYRYRNIVGVTLFDQVPLAEPLCPAGVIKGHRPGDNVSISYLNLKNSQQSCRTISFSGKPYWNRENDSLMFVMDSPLITSRNNRDDSCLNSLREKGELDLPEEMCVVGVFHRARADETLRKEIGGIQWGTVKAPLPEDQFVLFDQPDQIGRLAAAHEKAVVDNLLVAEQIQNEREEVQRRKDAERAARIAEAERKAAAKRDRIARNKARFALERGGGFTDSSSPGSMPNISGPFDGLHGKDLLNAIYARDWQAVSAVNSYYSNEKIRQNRRILGGKHWSDSFTELGFKSIDLSRVVLAVYLFNYQDKYASCLDKTAVTFTVIDSAPDISYKNILGQEIARSYGYEIHQQFKVKKEFTTAFRRVGRMKPESEMMAVAEFFLNQGGSDIKQQVVIGTKQMMSKYDCRSPEIETMEQALLQLSQR